LAQEVKPDVVLMDIAMPRMNGVEATREILKKVPSSKVLVLSSYSDDQLVSSMLEAGALGYITKHSASDDLLEAIRQVDRGRQYLSPRISQRFQRRTRAAFLSGRARGQLSPREKEVLTLIAQGLPSKAIAAQLGLSVKTVEKHRQAVMDKLDIHDIAGLTRHAAAQGMLPPAPVVAAVEAAPEVAPGH
jgi:DNA-binding NarL/FixJ family response regulator